MFALIDFGDPGAVSREKRRDESFQARAEEPLGTDSHWTISKRSSEHTKRPQAMLFADWAQFIIQSIVCAQSGVSIRLTVWK